MGRAWIPVLSLVVLTLLATSAAWLAAAPGIHGAQHQHRCRTPPPPRVIVPPPPPVERVLWGRIAWIVDNETLIFAAIPLPRWAGFRIWWRPDVEIVIVNVSGAEIEGGEPRLGAWATIFGTFEGIGSYGLPVFNAKIVEIGAAPPHPPIFWILERRLPFPE